MMATIFLATVIGWYLVIISLFLLVQREQVKAIVSDVFAQQGLFFVVAIITVILGLLMVTSHNVWVMGWPVVVTLICWLTLVSGLIRLICPDTAKNMARSFVAHPLRLQITGAVTFLIGLYLLIHVYYPF